MSGATNRGALARKSLQHPVATAFAVALCTRVALAAAVAVARGGTLFVDDATYVRIARAVADGRVHALAPTEQLLYEQTRPLILPIASLFRLLGPDVFGGQLYVALLGAATAALTALLALEVVSARWALAAGLLVALLPSQILWSSLVLKDAVVWALLCAISVVAARAMASTGGRLALLAVAGVVLLALLHDVRVHSMEVALIALVIASAFSVRRARTVRVAGAVAMLVCLPIVFGMGPAGVSYFTTARGPTEQRVRNARFANSSVDVEPSASDISYLPTGITVIALRPWPWERSTGSTGMNLARAETVVWYPILLLAVGGLATAWRRRRGLAFPLAASAGLLVVYALTEGNLGTAYRHRGEVVWAVMLLAALGMEQGWRLIGRHGPGSRGRADDAPEDVAVGSLPVDGAASCETDGPVARTGV